MSDIKESLILSQLIQNQEYRLKVIPYLNEEYFSSSTNKILFKTIKDYISKYNFPPSKEGLIISLKPKVAHFTDEHFKALSDVIDNELYVINEANAHPLQWLYDTTESFCQDQAIFNSIQKSIEIYQGVEKELSRDSIPDLLKDSLSISFDTKIGIDYLSDSEEQYEFYSRKESGIPFDIPILNRITNDIGLPRKAISVIIAGTNAGKSLSKCHIAASAIRMGFNVIYFTMEMAAERIGQRIDANLLDMEHNDIPLLLKDDYMEKMKEVKKFCKGKLFIKEFPTGSATSAHFRHVLEELRAKKDIKIDLMIVDYLNICSTSRYKNLSGVNTNTTLKAVTEEIRGLAMEYDLAALSSAQVNRGNMDNQDMGLDAISESIGITHTADIVLSFFRNEQLDALNRVLITQLKNRYDDLTKNKRFLVGIERSKMKLFPVGEDEVKSFLGQGTAKEEEVYTPSPEVNSGHFKGRSAPKSNFSDFKY